MEHPQHLLPDPLRALTTSHPLHAVAQIQPCGSPGNFQLPVDTKIGFETAASNSLLLRREEAEKERNYWKEKAETFEQPQQLGGLYIAEVKQDTRADTENRRRYADASRRYRQRRIDKMLDLKNEVEELRSQLQAAVEERNHWKEMADNSGQRSFKTDFDWFRLERELGEVKAELGKVKNDLNSQSYEANKAQIDLKTTREELWRSKGRVIEVEDELNAEKERHEKSIWDQRLPPIVPRQQPIKPFEARRLPLLPALPEILPPPLH